MNTELIIAYLIKLFDFKSLFVVNRYNETNNIAYSKIIKCLLYNQYYKDSFLVSDELKKFIFNSLFKREILKVLDNERDITDFIIAYNYFRGYIPFKKSYESHKFNYISVLGIRGNKFLFISIKSEIIDKCKTYIICNTDLYESVMNNYDITESFKDFKLDIFNNCLIKDKKLKKPKTHILSLERLIDIFYTYKKSIKIDNEAYTVKLNEFDNESYYRFLVSDFYNYYSKTDSLKEFFEFLTDYKGLKLDMSLNEWINLKTETNNSYDYISLVYYIQLLQFLESKKSLYNHILLRVEFNKLVSYITELKDKNIKFDKNLILFILDSKTEIKYKSIYRDFIKNL